MSRVEVDEAGRPRFGAVPAVLSQQPPHRAGTGLIDPEQPHPARRLRRHPGGLHDQREVHRPPRHLVRSRDVRRGPGRGRHRLLGLLELPAGQALPRPDLSAGLGVSATSRRDQTWLAGPCGVIGSLKDWEGWHGARSESGTRSQQLDPFAAEMVKDGAPERGSQVGGFE